MYLFLEVGFCEKQQRLHLHSASLMAELSIKLDFIISPAKNAGKTVRRCKLGKLFEY